MKLHVANFTHQFLIAMPGMQDPRFSESITYMLHHDPEGAVGLVINKPTDLSVHDLLKEVAVPAQISLRRPDAKVLNGGPVAQHVGFVLHYEGGDWTSTRILHDGLRVTSSKDILQAIAKGHGPDDYLIALGYAGWGPGQIEQEMAANAWLNCPADQSILFSVPFDERWGAAARMMGVDVRLLHAGIGHA